MYLCIGSKYATVVGQGAEAQGGRDAKKFGEGGEVGSWRGGDATWWRTRRRALASGARVGGLGGDAGRVGRVVEQGGGREGRARAKAGEHMTSLRG